MTTPAVRSPHREASAGPLPLAYQAHPLLDPHLPRHHPATAKLWIDTYRRMREDPAALGRVLESFARSDARALAGYYRDADAYLNDLLRLVPDALARHLKPLPETRGLNDIAGLLRATFEARSSRNRYEAQRKLYLSKMLFDVDHCRSVRDGPRHRERFEAILGSALWADTFEAEDVEVCCTLRNGSGEERLEVGVPPSPGARCWRFHVRRLAPRGRDPRIDVYHYRSRFKREADPATDLRADDGLLRLSETPRWPGLGGRSGSILSKMIRRGIPDPQMVQDLLGAMFIVGSRREAYALERRLIQAFGGPLRWRDRVDTLSGQRDRERLDPQSSSGFHVLKGIVDVLYDDEPGASYLFAVEIQIFPVGAYLGTLYDAYFASHTAYKRRQFLRDLLPVLFPPEIYGWATAALGNGAADGGSAR